MIGSLNDAPGLPERARFLLLHCEQPMRFLGSGASLTQDMSALATSCGFRCDTCGSKLELNLTEPG
jgi:hypothetical protein